MVIVFYLVINRLFLQHVGFSVTTDVEKISKNMHHFMISKCTEIQ